MLVFQNLEPGGGVDSARSAHALANRSAKYSSQIIEASSLRRAGMSVLDRQGQDQESAKGSARGRALVRGQALTPPMGTAPEGPATTERS